MLTSSDKSEIRHAIISILVSPPIIPAIPAGDMASTSRTSPPAGLTQIISSLRDHLQPTPILSALPTTLQLFAHLQLVSTCIKREAATALRKQGDLLQRLAEEGVDEGEMISRGALNRAEGRNVRKWAKRDEGDVMMGLSMEYRKHVCRVPE
jgi:hypothetical protein